MDRAAILDYWWFRGRTLGIDSVVEPYVSAHHNAILDLGSNAGFTVPHFQRYGSIVGLDRLFSALAHFKLGTACSCVQADATSLPFKPHSFTLVLMLDTLEHILEDTTVLRECHDVLAPDGLLVIAVPAFSCFWSRNDDANAHVRRYTRRGLRTRLATTGFVVERLTYNNAFLVPVHVIAALAYRLSARSAERPTFDCERFCVDLPPVPRPLNRVLTYCVRAEAMLLRKLNFHLGTSIICLARKSRP